MMSTTSRQRNISFNWIKLAQYGLIGGIGVLYVCLVGMVEAFDKRDVIGGVLSLGRALLVVISLGIGYIAASRLSGNNAGKAMISGVVVGLMSGVMATILVLITGPISLREMFVNASPALIKILTFSQESQTTGLLMLIGALTGLSWLGALIYLIPPLPRRILVAGLSAVLLIGMLQELLNVILSQSNLLKSLAGFLFARRGLSILGTIIIFVIFAGLNGLWSTQNQVLKSGVSKLPATQRQTLNWIVILIGIGLLLVLPQAVGPYISQVLVLVGLYTLMGLGLNLEIGLAGLLDLGFVGFFAISAYTVALFTSTSELGLASAIANQANGSYSSFWVAIPIAVIVSALAGVFLGIPVLRTRGDYLAIVTLGLAEIIRILVLSDFLRPVLGGAQGILNIPKPTVDFLNSVEFILKDPGHFYYLVLIGCAVLAFIAWRLQNARIGRNWMAMREDEDVAEAMGINLIASKLLAFGLGAGFAGLSGAIFAAQVGSVFPHSFGLIVSINVLSLVIIGGIGSIPGVIIGALVLVGLPELLREFSEFRFLIYGALLIVMMLVKPEGFWPSEVSRRELLEEESQPVEVETLPASQAQTA